VLELTAAFSKELLPVVGGIVQDAGFMSDGPKVAFAFLTSTTTGLVELDRDWTSDGVPALALSSGGEISVVEKREPQRFGLESGYFVVEDKITFVLDPTHYPWFTKREPRVYLAGDCNEWNPWRESERWELKRKRVCDRIVFAATFAGADQFLRDGVQFKFITAEWEWLSPPDDAPNRTQNELWNANLRLDAARTGHHCFRFTTRSPIDLSEETFLCWRRGEAEEKLLLSPGRFFFDMRSDLPLGALVEGNGTTFRLFAPRAQRVQVRYFRKLGPGRVDHSLDLSRNPDGTWEGKVPRNLDRWFYWLFLDGGQNDSLQFQAEFPVVDPYAHALVGRAGPGIILDRRRTFPPIEKPHQPPPWQDLVIAEIHVRDMIGKAPAPINERDRLGFTGLRKWVRSRHSYLRKLGINAVELQPVQEFDSETREEYHWGYMPVNYFAPESSYGRDPEKASQVEEFRELVRAFHDEGVSIILDVVYNHVGIPNHLLLIDKEYYFEVATNGELLNWSGCGNDLRAGAAMARRLIIDSLIHWVQAYDVDGFRFDLAELLGVETLQEIERELKKVKPGVILIAEPWSFRGHIGRQLRETGYSSWNDGFRDFLRLFVRGEGNHEAIRYFISGSPGGLATWPAQTVNYVESHDDRTWIDVITENPDHDGMVPTENDRRRTHLMAAFLFASLGIPMLAAGQDFLRSKAGFNNTYQRGDLNALDYGRLARYRASHDYFASWIHFRRSEAGRLLRLWEHPTQAYLTFSFAEQTNAFAVIINADRSRGSRRLLLALNPHLHDIKIETGETAAGAWRLLATEDLFARDGETLIGPAPDVPLCLPPLSCRFWSE
jgi:pullulanase